jgi:hypothetical protein
LVVMLNNPISLPNKAILSCAKRKLEKQGHSPHAASIKHGREGAKRKYH